MRERERERENIIVFVGSQIVAHTLIETGDGPNRPNTIDL